MTFASGSGLILAEAEHPKDQAEINADIGTQLYFEWCEDYHNSMIRPQGFESLAKGLGQPDAICPADWEEKETEFNFGFSPLIE